MGVLKTPRGQVCTTPVGVRVEMGVLKTPRGQETMYGEDKEDVCIGHLRPAVP